MCVHYQVSFLRERDFYETSRNHFCPGIETNELSLKTKKAIFCVDITVSRLLVELRGDLKLLTFREDSLQTSYDRFPHFAG